MNLASDHVSQQLNGVVERVTASAIATAFSKLLVTCQRLRGAGVITLYHRVADEVDLDHPPLHPDTFGEHLLTIKKHYAIVHLSELLERKRSRKSLARCCAITFDDGYRDFLTHVYPILRREQVPVTHFLVGESLLYGFATVNWRLNRASRLYASSDRQADPSAWSGDRCDTVITRRLKMEDLQTGLLEWERELGLSPFGPPMLNVEDLCVFDAGLVEWGSHTMRHLDLGQASEADLEYEVAESRRRITDVVGKDVRFFAYPKGSVSPAAVSAVKEAGYRAGFAVGQDTVSVSHSDYQIPPFDMADRRPSTVLLELSGAIQGARRLRSFVRRSGGVTS